VADFVGWIGDFLALPIATVDTVSVTLGLVIAGALLVGLAINSIKKLRSRA